MNQIIKLMDSRKDYFEMIAYSVRTGYASAMTGDPINMFDKKSKSNDETNDTKSETRHLSDIEKVDMLNAMF